MVVQTQNRTMNLIIFRSNRRCVVTSWTFVSSFPSVELQRLPHSPRLESLYTPCPCGSVVAFRLFAYFAPFAVSSLQSSSLPPLPYVNIPRVPRHRRFSSFASCKIRSVLSRISRISRLRSLVFIRVNSWLNFRLSFRNFFSLCGDSTIQRFNGSTSVDPPPVSPANQSPARAFEAVPQHQHM